MDFRQKLILDKIGINRGRLGIFGLT